MSNEQQTLPIRNNAERRRFEVEIDGLISDLSYFVADGRAVFVHTAVPAALEGRGIAGALTRHALNWARNEGLRVVPRCPYVRAYLNRHHEWDDILDSPA